jgi:prepilin-type N-terminal cleavage/methylation domain-containing protein
MTSPRSILGLPLRPVGPASRRGFSLPELLVASALSLVVMGAVASLFSVFGRSVSEGQSMAELNARLRNAAWRLRQDLVGLTCDPVPLVRVEANAGYFQVIEGPETTSAAAADLLGDIDDVLAFTTSSPGAPFTGRLAGARGFESPTAEVIWFCEQSDQQHRGQTLYNLYRRQLLVAATPDAGSFADNPFAARGDSDLSHNEHANSLGDLSKEANRFLTTAGANRRLIGAREGEDMILGNVIAFDVRISRGEQQPPALPVDQSFETTENGDPEGAPLRGVEIRIRCVNPASDQVRELKVVHLFGMQ